MSKFTEQARLCEKLFYFISRVMWCLTVGDKSRLLAKWMMKRIPWFKRWVIRQVEFSNVVPSRLCYCRKSQPFVAISLLFPLQIPVFLSQALTKNLYIYQYPVRPATRDWNDTNIVNASVKPRNQMVRLEVGLDTYSEKYCSSKGEQIALNTDGHQVMLQSLLKPSHMLFCVTRSCSIDVLHSTYCLCHNF